MAKKDIDQNLYYQNLVQKVSQIKDAKSKADDGNLLKHAALNNIFFEALEKYTFPRIGKNLKVYKGKTSKETDRIVTIVLSDLHFGSDLNEQEGLVKFGRVEEARRLAAVAQQVVDYKRQHRDNTSLNVMILGDLIDNIMHDPRNGTPLAEQTGAAIDLLTQFLFIMRQAYKKVDVHCATGNHDRFTSRHSHRAVNEKFDSIGSVIYLALRRVFAHTDITINIPKTPYFSVQNFDKRGWYSHGDGVLMSGSPAKNVNIEKLNAKINEINNSTKHHDLYVIGHNHVGSMIHLNSGVILLTNGALCPANQFAQSLGIMQSNAGQWMFESTPGHIVGDSRYIQVNERDDKDATLDQIIKPFEWA